MRPPNPLYMRIHVPAGTLRSKSSAAAMSSAHRIPMTSASAIRRIVCPEPVLTKRVEEVYASPTGAVTARKSPATKLTRSLRSNRSTNATADLTSDEYCSRPMNRHLPNSAPAAQNLPAPEPMSTTVRIPTASSQSAARFTTVNGVQYSGETSLSGSGRKRSNDSIVGAASSAHHCCQTLRGGFHR